MKNKIIYQDEKIVEFLVNNKNYGEIAVKIDTENLNKIINYDWRYQVRRNGEKFVLSCPYKNIEKKTIPLSKLIFGKERRVIYRINPLDLDYRKENIKIFRKNNITYQDNEITKILIEDNKYGNFETIIDTEDYEKIQNYRWTLNVSQNGYKRPIYTFYKKEKRMVYFVHQLIVPYKHTDHIDRNPFNCRKNNLRESNKITNGQNRGKNKNNTTGFKGVTFRKYNNTYSAEIMFNRKRIRIHGFQDKIDAAKKYNELALKYHKEFACLNIIPEEVQK
jgi:hypothetical protein